MLNSSGGTGDETKTKSKRHARAGPVAKLSVALQQYKRNRIESEHVLKN